MEVEEARKWVKVDSWHIVERTQQADDMWSVETVCGLKLANVGEIVEQFPFSEKTCESCFRLGVKS